MIGERLDVLPECITTSAVNNQSITDCVIHLTSHTKANKGEHKETGQLELSSELKYTVYSLFI